ncbi:zeta toxin family protein [Mucilaginibacter sp.]|jgi:predicted ABC-type ATPase|uniref:zeta toxin family protein n=1 Tax=Mucilaginibacter sp. TaxID=1882438 RepID=UPI00356611BD
MPSVVVVGGPNGSGKTTLTSHLIQRGRIKTDVINPDSIALNEFGGYQFHVKAARVALEKRHTAIEENSDLAFETTFSGNSEIRDIILARSMGYETVLYYVALQSILDNVIRVEERKTNMGHNVELEDLIRRYDKSKANLIKHINLFDRAYLFDNSGSKRSRVAIFNNGKLSWLNVKHDNHPFYKELF